MIIKTKQDKTIDLAWERLYNRLEQDNLLPNKETSSVRTIFLTTGFRWAAGIAMLCVCILTVLLLKQRIKTAESELLVLHNEMNAPTLATTLEDGSIVYLSEQATIYYPEHFQEDKRVVTLMGNAFFEVDKQPERPFVIDTEAAKIEVLGTSFQVKSCDKSSFHLAVRSGEVRVTLKKNNQILYVIRAGEAALLESGALQLSKTDGHQFDNCFEKICFKDERLADIARIINFHSNSTPIEVAAESGNRRLSFVYSGETPEDAAQLMCMALNINYLLRHDVIFITQ
jgi:ferric-dicitrate binding protein FerR (iron transport regulator)